VETSLILALRNELVNMSEAKAEYPLSYQSKFLTLEGKMSPAWLTTHISKNGIVGDPTTANSEAGKKIIENLVNCWCDFIKDVSRLELKSDE
jgi:creatinine amidohydrolase